MTELTRPARALLNAAHAARTPSDRDRERVFAAMLATSLAGNASRQDPREHVLIAGLQAPVPAPVRASSRPPPRSESVDTFRPPAPPRRSPLLWVGATACALAIGFGSYFAVSSGRSEKTDVAVNAASPADEANAIITVSRALAEAPAEAKDTLAQGAPSSAEIITEQKGKAVEESSKTPPALKKERRRNKRERDDPEKSQTKDDGARMLFAAERSFRMGQTQRALEMVQAHERRYPDSELAIERNALRAQLLCEMGRTRAARRVVLELEADHASDRVLASVDQACTDL